MGFNSPGAGKRNADKQTNKTTWAICLQESKNTMNVNLTINRIKLAALFGGALILTSLATDAIAAQRPISDFLSRQGKFCLQLDANGFVDCDASHYADDTTSGGCFLF